MASGDNEAFSRVLIDKALEFSGWDLLERHQVRFEINGASGRADYVLAGQHGPLAVLEAKREEGPNSYRVPIEKIRENDWSLAAGRYKAVTAEVVKHDAPADILSDVLKLESSIAEKAKALQKRIVHRP